eukprot:COSAG02_NODE_22571_length_747_cov_14.310185_1_plen_123_part_10
MECVELALAVNAGVVDSVLVSLGSVCGDELSGCTGFDGCMSDLRVALSEAELPTDGSDELLSVVACVEGSGLDLYSSRRGMYSLAGGECVDCGVGKQPASNYGTCVDCGAGEYSGGDLCRRCP